MPKHHPRLTSSTRKFTLGAVANSDSGTAKGRSHTRVTLSPSSHSQNEQSVTTVKSVSPVLELSPAEKGHSHADVAPLSNHSRH